MCVHVFSESQPIFTAGQRIDNNFGLTRVSLGHTKISSINIKSEQNNLVAADSKKETERCMRWPSIEWKISIHRKFQIERNEKLTNESNGKYLSLLFSLSVVCFRFVLFCVFYFVGFLLHSWLLALDRE